MKILLAPSKSRNYNISSCYQSELTAPIFETEANYIASRMQEISKEQLSVIMKIKKNLLEQTFDEYGEFDISKKHAAIESYTGTVFKELNLFDYNKEQLEYLSEKVRILSALYGVLRPFDGIKYYRLDMNMKVLDSSSYKFWKDKINQKSISGKNAESETIINLSSSEFTKMLSCSYINVDFREEVAEDSYKTVGVYAKKARGKMVNYMILNKIESVAEIIKFNLDGYSYNEMLSSEKNIVFTRKPII